MDNKAVNLKLPPKLKHDVKVCAAVEGVTMQVFMCTAIQGAVQAHKAHTGASR